MQLNLVISSNRSMRVRRKKNFLILIERFPSLAFFYFFIDPVLVEDDWSDSILKLHKIGEVHLLELGEVDSVPHSFVVRGKEPRSTYP